MTDSDTIRALLARDALAEAEDITGESYKDDEGTMALGLLKHLALVDEKRRTLSAAGDTHFSMPYAEACEVYERLGFERVGTYPFAAEDGSPEELSLWWHADGLLLKAETYCTTRLNSSSVYYNTRFHEPLHPQAWSRLSSHGPIDGSTARAGYHDAREGLAANLDGIREVADFLPVWEERPFLWLLNYRDAKVEGYDHDAINEARIAELPQNVQSAIRGGVR